MNKEETIIYAHATMHLIKMLSVANHIEAELYDTYKASASDEVEWRLRRKEKFPIMSKNEFGSIAKLIVDINDFEDDSRNLDVLKLIFNATADVIDMDEIPYKNSISVYIKSNLNDFVLED